MPSEIVNQSAAMVEATSLSITKVNGVFVDRRQKRKTQPTGLRSHAPFRRHISNSDAIIMLIGQQRINSVVSVCPSITQDYNLTLILTIILTIFGSIYFRECFLWLSGLCASQIKHGTGIFQSCSTPSHGKQPDL